MYDHEGRLLIKVFIVLSCAMVNTCVQAAVVDQAERTHLSLCCTTLQQGSAKILGPELEDYCDTYMIPSLIPRLFPPPVFDHLQYAIMKGKAWEI